MLLTSVRLHRHHLTMPEANWKLIGGWLDLSRLLSKGFGLLPTTITADRRRAAGRIQSGGPIQVLLRAQVPSIRPAFRQVRHLSCAGISHRLAKLAVFRVEVLMLRTTPWLAGRFRQGMLSR